MTVINRFTDFLSPHRVLRIRHRHLLTRNNKPRLRYVAGTLLVSTALLSGVLGGSGASVAFAPEVASYSSSDDDYVPVIHLASKDDVAGAHVGAVSSEGKTLSDGQQALETVAVLDSVAGDSDDGSADDASQDDQSGQVASADPSAPREEILQIGSGDTLAGVLQNVGVSGSDAYNAIKAMAKYYDPRSVKAGQAVAVRLEPADDGFSLAEMNLKIDPIKEVVVEKNDDSTFQSAVKEKKVILETKAAKASIQTSLYGSAARAGIPASVVAEMIRIYSYQVDFQRDIREGDKIEIMYETYETEDGDFARYGNVLYANLEISGKEMPLYRFEPKNGHAGYYTPDGKSIKKSLMRTPIDGARISSGFGMRHHPILGYNRMHKGIDFAAPRGTPIYAAGDGTIDFIGRRGGYGNFIRIRHNGTYKTAYGHMYKFADGMSKGTHVKQGEVIGYVGSTGRSTGPHLHYEVIKNGTAVNPATITLPASPILAGADLKRFKSEISSFKQEYATLANGLEFAENQVNDRSTR